MFYYFFLLPKSLLAAAAPTAAGGDKKERKMLQSFWAAVLLSASVERFFISRMRDFFKKLFVSKNEKIPKPEHALNCVNWRGNVIKNGI